MSEKKATNIITDVEVMQAPTNLTTTGETKSNFDFAKKPVFSEEENCQIRKMTTMSIKTPASPLMVSFGSVIKPFTT